MYSPRALFSPNMLSFFLFIPSISLTLWTPGYRSNNEPIPILLFCGTTLCVVSILGLYLMEPQRLSTVLTPITRDYVYDSLLYSFSLINDTMNFCEIEVFTAGRSITNVKNLYTLCHMLLYKFMCKIACLHIGTLKQGC